MARACRWSRSAGSPASSPNREARPPRRSTVSVLESFRGHMVNDDAPEAQCARSRSLAPDQRVPAVVSRRSISCARSPRVGFADLSQVHAWNQEFVASSREGRRFEDIAEGIDRALRFMAACGIDLVAGGLAPSGRLLDEPRGADPRVRGGADPPRLADRRLVRLLRAHALGGREDPTARRRAL